MKRLKAIFVLIFVLMAASAARAQSTSGVNDAELNGNYAFTFDGFTGSGGSFTVFAAVGRFTADGAGNVTSGVMDSNGVSAASVLTAQPFTGTYMIGADHRGTLTLDIAGATAKFAFAMLANGNAEFIRFDAAGGTGTIGSGTIEKADSTAFSIAQIAGDYAFGLGGLDASGGRVTFAGRLTSSGTGNFSNEVGDINSRGSFGPATFTSSIYTVTDTTHGRGTTSLTIVFGGSFTLNFVFYIVNSGRLLVMETDSLAGGSFPLLNGPMVRQQTPAGGFSNGSLNGSTVISLTGRQVCGGAANPDVIAGLIIWNGSGSFTLPFDENCGGVLNSPTGFSGTYTVAPNGRVAITLTGIGPEIAYLIGTNQIFFLASGPETFLGSGDPQAAGAFSNGSVTGNYAGFATTPQTPSVTILSGEFSADGASPTGHLTGTVDIGNASGPTSGAAFAATYSISSSPTNGRGSVTITSPAGVNGIAYLISPTKFVVLPSSDTSPSLWHFEQAPSTAPPPPPTVTLSSLALNPTTVVGGQSSTGTVTLSGAAPSGGGQVMLSSSNTTVAQVPSSVTVQAGQTTATFTITTKAVTASTAVTISGTFGGVTRNASLTVTPPPPPTVTLSSLALNPTTVVGGQSSTGTVTLSAAAPSGGAQVTLSSSNTTVAQVPSSVTVQAGQTTATFTVTTKAVTASTAVTISGTFGGVTRNASLTVTPPPPPTVTLSSLALNPAMVVGGQSSTGTVTLSGAAPSGGAQVTLSSSNTAVAQVPSSVTVQAGQTTATFTITTKAATASTAVTISATFGGVTRTASLTVTSPTLTSLVLSPTTVVGSRSSTGTVTLSGPAPSSGAQVVLSSSNTAVASVPSSVTIAAGSTSATFTVSTSLVLSSTNVTISATFGGVTRTASLTVTPPPLPTVTSLTLNPSSVTGGPLVGTSTGTVSLSGPAPSGGAQIALSSSNSGVASVPSSVTIAAGSTSATFTVSTSLVLSSTNVTISASYNGTTKQAALTVNPVLQPLPLL